MIYNQNPQPIKDPDLIKIIKEEALALQKRLKAFPLIADFKTKQGYEGIIIANDPILSRSLERGGFFNFHITNIKRKVAYIHQIVAFANFGYECLLQGWVCPQGEVEIHHKNSRVNDNSASNLRYVSPLQNKIISQAIHTGYYGKADQLNEGCPFNNQGKKVQNHRHRTATLINESLAATWNCFQYESKLIDFLKQLPKKIFSSLHINKMQNLVHKDLEVKRYTYHKIKEILKSCSAWGNDILLSKKLEKRKRKRDFEESLKDPIFAEYAKQYDLSFDPAF